MPGPKFSFLLPSKNRLELLKYAIESILQQQFGDFEIIVSDNASRENYKEYVESLNESRIRYFRTSSSVSVTENWNNALSKAKGDYILMLGDDDALIPGFCAKAGELLEGFKNPDILFASSYHYCYPKVMPLEPEGYLADVRNSVFCLDVSEPFALSPQIAKQVAMAIFNFEYRFGFNSQHFIFRRGFLNSLRSLGGVFQGPYPDTFAAAVSFLKAKRIVVSPEPLVIIGISQKSFGYYYYNDKQEEGFEFLANAMLSKKALRAVKKYILPGDRNNTNWLIAAEAARQILSRKLKIGINFDRYRLLQIVYNLRQAYLPVDGKPVEIPNMEPNLSEAEKLVFSVLSIAVESAKANGTSQLVSIFEDLRIKLAQFTPAKVVVQDIGVHHDIMDAFNFLKIGKNKLAVKTQIQNVKKIICPYCGDATKHKYTASDLNQKTSSQKFKYHKCQGCDLTFIVRIPDNLGFFYTNEQYNIPASGKNFKTRAESQMWKVDFLKRFTQKGKLFEVGAATGEFAFSARESGFSPELAEMDPECYAFLKNELKLKVVNTSRADEHLKSKMAYFDVICIWQAIEHVPEFWVLLKRFVYSVKKNGTIIVSTPNPDSLQARLLGRFWPHLDAPRHLYLIPQSWFERFARENNLEIVTMTTRDAGSLGLNYYGWYLAVRNFFGKRSTDTKIHTKARKITDFFGRWENAKEGLGCSYTVVFKKL